MNVTFTEEDGTERKWEKFRPGKMPTTEAEEIEKVTGMTFTEWGQALMNGSTVAGRALVWVLKKRDLVGEERRAFRFRDVVYTVDSLLISLDEDERVKVRERLELDDTLTDEERAQIQAALGEQDLEVLDFEPEPDGPGNESAPSGSASD